MIFWPCMEGEKTANQIRHIWGRSKSSIYQKYKDKHPLEEMTNLSVLGEPDAELKHGDKRYKFYKSYPKMFPPDFQEFFKRKEEKLRNSVFKFENLKILVNNNLSLLIEQWYNIIAITYLVSMKPEFVFPKKIHLIEDLELFHQRRLRELRNSLSQEVFEKIKIEEDKMYSFFRGLLEREEKRMKYTESVFIEAFPLLDVKNYLKELKRTEIFIAFDC